MGTSQKVVDPSAWIEWLAASPVGEKAAKGGKRRQKAAKVDEVPRPA
jgi:hypothetical protein